MTTKKILKLGVILSIISIIFVIYGIKNEEGYAGTKFKDNVVFYAQHQDDETLWASSAIIDAINQVGADHVYVVQVSYGTGIKVFNNEETFKNMTKMEKYKCREREFLDAVKALGVKRKNVILLSRINKSDSTSFELMEKVALHFEKSLKSVTHVAHTYKLDWHLQHLKNGSVIQCLYNADKIKDVMYFVKPEYEKYISDNEKIVFKTMAKEDREKIKKACYAYKEIDVNKKRYGIGYKSDHRSFERLMRNYSSILHTAKI
ncbi:PIG-L family deacetylase [Intestinibacter sp.]